MDELPYRTPQKQKWAQQEWYQYVIYALCFAIGFLTLGFCSSNSGLYLTAITKALDMSRSTYSLRNVFHYIATTILQFFFGTLVARFGEKKMTCVGIISLIFAVLTSAWAESAALLYVSGLLLGIGFSFCATTMLSYIVSRWCTKKRGLIMGLVLSANGLGSAAAAQIVTPIIYDKTDIFGYRKAYYLIAVMLAALLVLVVIFLREPPMREREKFERHKKRAGAATWSGVNYATLTRKPFFYVTLLTIFCSAFAITVNTADLSPLMTDQGIDEKYIAVVLSAHSLALTAGKIFSGMIYDRIKLRKTMLLCQMFVLLSMVSMLLVSSSGFGCTMAMVSGITAALGMPIQTVLVSCLVFEMFGDCDYAKLIGVCMAAVTAGMAVGHYIGNLVYDLCGSYKPILAVLTGVMAVVVLVFQLCVTAANKMRREIEADTL